MHIFNYYVQIYNELQLLNNDFEKAIINFNNNINQDSNQETDNEIINQDNTQNSKPEKINTKWIKKILLKLLFIYHPDKNINPDQQIFSQLNNSFQSNDFSQLFYHFIIQKDNPFINSLFNEISSTNQFITSIETVTNLMLLKINHIKSNKIFQEYHKKIDFT